ncbi:uncharacterized protein LOC101893440 [Musca domestica]|uniref:Uncharacterized protein LOC101893440 n=3 Tax=Musca domestica TaxID=7370 RepID=A0A9J7IA21_MUSDO|nr:uncharacterized protein LOC101893440 [Musca domestica]
MSDNTVTWQAPEWLNDSELLEKILKDYLGDGEVKIEKIDWEPATANGENYASIMTRIKIYFRLGQSEEIQDLSFIIKCCYDSDPVLQNLMKSYNLYQTEMKMYEQVLPQITKILQEADEGALQEQLFAKTLNVNYERATIIFEDLSAKNYVMGNRLVGFDKLHARFVMEKLAKFHAAAAVLNEQLNGALQQFDRGLFNEHTRGLGCMFEYMIEESARYALTVESLGKYYHDKIMKLLPHVVEYGTKAYATNSPHHFYTLCHGDLWINNIMVKYGNTNSTGENEEESHQQLEDVLFVDFQFSSWTSPAIDLHYFFNTSIEFMFIPSTIDSMEGTLLKVNLEKSVSYDSHMMKDPISVPFGGVAAVTGILSDQAIATSDQCDDADVHCLIGDSERARNFRQNCYKNKRHQKIVQHFLPYLDRGNMCENNVWQAPKWLTNEYLQEVLKDYLKDQTVQITKVDIRPATANGENYASVMSRIKISFSREGNAETETLSFIMKYSYENDPVVSKIMSGYDIYNTEMKMYEQILPQLAEVLKESGDMEKLFAQTLKVDYERSTIIFEDLTVEGYEMADRTRGLDLPHIRMSMKKLAKFHAAAAVLNERQGGLLEQFDHGMFNRHTKGFCCVFEYLTQEAAHFAKNCPELGEYYADKLDKLTSKIVEYCTKAYAPNPWNFYSLNHGDLWTNNIMMLYEKCEGGKEKSLKDIMLIDFQLCNWSSVAVDIHYLFNTSLQSDLLVDIEVQEKLIQYYHGILSETLRKLKYKGHIPSLHEIFVQWEESRILAVNGLLAHRSIMTTNNSEDADIHSLLDDDERARKFRRTCFSGNKEYQNVLKKLLPLFDRRGLLDLQK